MPMVVIAYALVGAPLTTAGLFLALTIPVWILSPWLNRILFSGKAWNVAPIDDIRIFKRPSEEERGG